MKVRLRSPLWRRLARVVSRRLFRVAENNDDPRFARNGERWLLGEVLRGSAPENAPPAVILDVGANVGGYTREALQLAREVRREIVVHAFEPSPHCVETLRRDFAAVPNVHIVSAGLADRTGDAVLHAGREGSSLASLVARPGYAGDPQDAIRVSLTRLEDYLGQHGIGRVELLKLDVEGYELSALRGAGALLNPDTIDVIQFEYGGTTMDAGATLRDLFGLLVGRGYAVGKLYPDAVELRDYAPWMEHYAYSNYVALSPRWSQAVRARR